MDYDVGVRVSIWSLVVSFGLPIVFVITCFFVILFCIHGIRASSIYISKNKHFDQFTPNSQNIQSDEEEY